MPTLAVPANDGQRLDKDEVALPSAWPEATEPDPEDSVTLLKPQPRLAPKGDVQLMAQGQVLERQVAAAAKRREDHAKQEKNGSEHPPEYQRPAPSTAGAYIQIDFCRPTAPQIATSRGARPRSQAAPAILGEKV